MRTDGGEVSITFRPFNAWMKSLQYSLDRKLDVTQRLAGHNQGKGKSRGLLSCGSIPTFQRSMLPPTTTPHSVTTQKTSTRNITAVKASKFAKGGKKFLPVPGIEAGWHSS